MPRKFLDMTGLTHFFSTIKAMVSTKAESSLSNVTEASFNGKAFDSQVITTGGSGSLYTATVPGITELVAGVSFVMIPHTVSTTTSTMLNVNGLGAKNLRQPLTSSTGTSTMGKSNTWITSGKPVRVTYDGTLWRVDIPQPSATALYGTVPIASGGTGATTADAARAALGAVGIVKETLYDNATGIETGTISGVTVDPSEYDHFEIIAGKNTCVSILYPVVDGSTTYIRGGTNFTSSGAELDCIAIDIQVSSANAWILQSCYIVEFLSGQWTKYTGKLYKIVGVKYT